LTAKTHENTPSPCRRLHWNHHFTQLPSLLCGKRLIGSKVFAKEGGMFSHIVIFWTNPTQPNAADELVAGARHYLAGIPGVLSFHVGKMAPSHRPVVDQSYQVGLYVQFADRKAQDAYQTHPLHLEFVEKVLNPRRQKVVVFDFE
jgi:hypothetical protein